MDQTPQESTPLVSIEVVADDCINFAMQHNAVPVVKRLAVAVGGDKPVEDVELSLTLTGELSGVWSRRVDRLDPGRPLVFDSIDLPLNGQTLAHCTERERAELIVTVTSAGKVVAEHRQGVDVLAYDEWAGVSSLPEILAAFVTPNHPTIERLLSEAHRHLELSTGDGSLSGYQRRDPARVRAMVEAIYKAVGDQQIGYINPPASYEQTGQRVRLPDQLLERKLGTCLDLTLLLAGMFEQAGLHPLIVLVKDHAFVAVWTEPDSFPESAVSEPLRLRKRMQLGEIIALETTLVTGSSLPSLDEAQRQAMKRMDDPRAFHYAVDVHTARSRSIRPLPVRVKAGTYEVIDEMRVGDGGAVADQGLGSGGDLGVGPGGAEAPPPGEEIGDEFAVALDEPGAPRIERWKRKLLDLSLRNRVLNFRDTKKSIPLAGVDVAGLEDRLAEGSKFEVLPKSDIMAGADPRSAEVHQQRSGEDAVQHYLNQEAAQGRLRATLTERELDKRLVEVYRAARLSLEESGANTLYLALGFLSWYETPTSQKERRAPILLLPVELERLPAQRGYRLTLADDDPRINVTLLEKLRAEYQLDIAGLDDLSLDESGVDVTAVLQKFRAAVKDIARWDVIEEAVLGLFSFTKFLMWRDLQDRSEQLMRSPVVRRLVLPGQNEAGWSLADMPRAEELDERFSPHETLCPTDADSSQLAAVFAADAGNSFVLEGPPGTGKSQTITNLIAHALAKGKRVLFVSEKMAALSVVQRRLAAMGVGPFCLELHSNQANKRRVLEQLDEALSVAGQRAPEQWQAEADRLAQSRATLNGLVETLHRDRPIGMSFYEATSALIGMRDVPSVGFGLEQISALSAERFDAMQRSADRLATAAKAVGPIGEHPYRAAGLTDYRTSLPDQLNDQSQRVAQTVAEISDGATKCLDVLQLHESHHPSVAELSRQTMLWLVHLLDLLTQAYQPSAKLLQADDFASVRNQIEQQVATGIARDAERKRLFERYHDRILEEDLSQLRAKLAEGMTALPIISWFKCYSIRKRLKLSLKKSKVPTNSTLLNDLDALIALKKTDESLAAADNPAAEYLGEPWQDGQAKWHAVLELLDWTEQFRQHFALPPAAAFGDEQSRNSLCVSLAIDRRQSIAQTGMANVAAAEMVCGLEHLDMYLADMVSLMQADALLAWGHADEPGYLDTISNTLEDWLGHTGQLRDWTHWCATRADAEEHDLGPLVSAYQARVISPSQFVEVVRRGVLAQWHAAVCDLEPVLGRFHSPEHERQIARFRAIDTHYLDLTAQQVRATLAEQVPLLFGEPTANSEVGILKRQLKLKRRHMPVRRLIRELPHLLPRLKPCLLMSPLSVAQYLDAEGTDDGLGSFDLVVFDEASQIPVWDAVGAIARGKSCVVVGDSKQLPPTSFFQKLESDSDESFGPADENDFVELESILDECSAAGLPSMRLCWHYRSRHESLIAFSNTHYYDGELNTFPSPVDETDTLGVSLRYIEEGIYDRGNTCTNPREAERLVAEVVDRLRGYDTNSYQSLGVVTFSTAQQVLIEDLLDTARRDNPQIDPFFTQAVDEPVFVKNLENVQGDERAEIFFSICYGPDESGKVAMNFGPLNREGGERRLNVAITRARRRVAVFMSLRADQIDLSRTQQVGVKHLRSFLDYAARGAAALAESPSTLDHEAHARGPFKLALADALRNRGHAVDLDVGLSGYRVSLAVKDPDDAGRYMLGVELDGPYYRNAPAARDRDRTRPAVMQGLGWRLLRLWSLDYWHAPDKAIAEVEQAIDRARRGEPEPSRDAGIPRERAASQSTSPLPRMMPGMELYKPYLPSKPAGDSDDFYASGKTNAVKRSLLRIAKQEAPIHSELLARRVLYSWQVSRLTSKAQDRVDQVIRLAVEAEELRTVEPFVWLAEQEPMTYAGFRVPPQGEDPPRHVEEIPPAEVANAAVAVLKQMVAMPREELDREVAVLFGFSRVTGRVQPTIDEAVQGLLDQGKCMLDAAGNVALAE